MVSLGCPKNLVDSEPILTKLRSEGYVVSDTYDGADVVIVNTCGFLNSAKQESLDAIGEALKENGKVIVTGCMGGNEQAIRSVHPGVLSVTGPQQYESVVSAVHKAVPPKHDPYVDLVPLLLDAEGFELPHFGFNAVLRDYARLGRLLAHDGVWNGRQIIPAQWMVDATTVRPSGAIAMPAIGRGVLTLPRSLRRGRSITDTVPSSSFSV